MSRFYRTLDLRFLPHTVHEVHPERRAVLILGKITTRHPFQLIGHSYIHLS